mmetsp:Transcript_32222/g.96597  ORF Transcript_32222/g.96597 Transcript_32222/m.96597 type:complete len:384 (-) Transcript_32222:238-1389(-)|eukprot:CAMPEP_0113556396 /NCGR_PEP_ID=MMETSP0015_2-20120614/17234_1 /TAXON_ID=2838 /ORGANISM="Odontella" /LENGTH=383 /DNA_ID=CAMNT_0000457749 /DNA_START=113 /DNA_END=1264 /DNA_ORIENTATION=- /assembly_acc=CAM_ASM_000160
MGRPSKSVPLLRGYLPVRVSLPDDRGDTFLFVKAHAGGGGKGGATLFVANAPSVPGVRTRLFLRALFERYGDVDGVTVVRNPRSGGGAGGDDESSGSRRNRSTATASAGEGVLEEQSRRFADPRRGGAAVVAAALEDPLDEGKFARVAFASPKQMQRAIKSLKAAMGKGTTTTSPAPVAVKFGALEVRELRDRSDRALRKEARAAERGNDTGDDDGDNDSSDDESDGDGEDGAEKPLEGLDMLVHRHESARLPRSKLLEACNAVMARYEDAEEEAERRARAAKEGPDEDGFITISHGPSVRQNLEDEDGAAGGGAVAATGRRKTAKRSRGKKKGMGGSAELQDFYRFQMKESRKRSLHELRQRFEEDLEKVKKMKEEKKYRPF